MKHRVSEELRQESLDRLRELLPPGTTVHCVLRHVSRSGMCRWIDLFTFEPRANGQKCAQNYLSGYAWNVGTGEGQHPGDQRDGRGGLRVSGCGMDMGFALVYDLSRRLYPDGFACIGPDRSCPSNDHNNRVERKHHPEGGYALRHAWI